ncbi:MAG: hypothetical protein HFJ84_00720 [Clostridiales bacterium]|jgi:hypothetical protein|nr:hypothetical protein [Clostridiales bacterium]
MLFTYAYGPNYNWLSLLNNRMSYTQNLQAIREVNRTNGNLAVTPVSSISPVLPGRNLLVNNNQVTSDSLDFLKEYQQKLNDLNSSANKISDLSQTDTWSKLELSSSNPAVAAVEDSINTMHQPASYDIGVQQLAQKQVTTLRTSNGDGSDRTFRDGTLRIETNRTDESGKNIGADISIKTEGKTNDQVQQDIVEQINAQAQTLGVQASLVTDDNSNRQIQLESMETGKSNAFLATASDGNNQLEATNQQLAQNLTYTVSKNKASTGIDRSFTRESESNENIAIDETGNKDLRVDFHSVGKTQIKTELDPEKLIEKAADLVKKFNDTMDFLTDNQERGTGVSRVRDQLKNSVKLSLAMEEIGFSWGTGDKLDVDILKLNNQLEKDPLKVRDVLERSDFADDIQKSSKAALNQSSASLLNQEKKEASNQAAIIQRYYYQGTTPLVYNYAPYLFQNPLFFNLYI